MQVHGKDYLRLSTRLGGVIIDHLSNTQAADNSSPSTNVKRDRSSLAIVYFTVFLDLMGFGIILPALPFYALELGASGFALGAVLTSYSAAQLIGASVLGRLSDRIGRKPILLFALAGQSISLLLTGLADSLITLMLARACAGLFGGSISAAQAYIADVTEPHERARFMGLLGAAIGVGFIAGPGIGAALSPFGFRTAAFVASGLAAGNFIFGVFKLKEARPASERRPRRRLSMALFLGSMTTRSKGPLLAATFLMTFAFVTMETTFALLGAERFGIGTLELGLVFVFGGIMIALVQGTAVGPLTSVIGEKGMSIMGFACMALGLVLIPYMPNLWLAIVGLGFLGLGQGLCQPGLSSLLSRNTSTEEQGTVLGLNQALAAAARVVGPLVAGGLYDLGPPLPYLLAAVLSVVGLVGLWRTAVLAVDAEE